MNIKKGKSSKKGKNGQKECNIKKWSEDIKNYEMGKLARPA